MATSTTAETPVDAWFTREVLPLEGALWRYLRRNWRDRAEVEDLRQEVYARVYEAGRRGLPDSTRAFVFSTARHLLIDRGKRARIVIFEHVAHMDSLCHGAEVIGPDRHCLARDQLLQLQAALDALPPRCREVVILRKLHGVPQREVAARLGVTEDTVERQVLIGVRRLSKALFGEPATKPEPLISTL